jgi:hypothetical protein
MQAVVRSAQCQHAQLAFAQSFPPRTLELQSLEGSSVCAARDQAVPVIRQIYEGRSARMNLQLH